MGNDTASFECKTCGNTYKSRTALNLHCWKKGHSVGGDWACSVCGRTFPTKGSLGRHASRGACAGSRIVEAECQRCGRPFVIRQSFADNGRKYCSHSCAIEDRTTRVTKLCAHCGKPFDVESGQVDMRKYCSKHCAQKLQAQTMGICRVPVERRCEECGESFQTWQSSRQTFCSKRCRGASARKRIETTCTECGKVFVSFPSRRQAGKGKCCSVACRGKQAAKSYSGENSWNWKGGAAAYDSARHEWNARIGRHWRRMVLKAAGGVCAVCGKVHRTASTLVCHHRASWIAFPDLRDDPRNGKTVCGSCHDFLHSNSGRELREGWEREALAELEYLLTGRRAAA